jgi:hypothetical protein
MIGVLLNIAWFTVCFLFLAAVVGSIALTRWRHREADDAAETERVMESLKADTTHQYEMDAL